MQCIPEIFGSMVFNEKAMQSRLPKDIFLALKKTISKGAHLELDVANVVANAMKDWAVEKGATHFTHWFHPLTGITAEKHESFISPAGNGQVIMEFSGRELVRGEPDASSFPSGGLRSTFEARGYTVWDTTSYAFIKNDTLYIPTAFCAYNGESLDMKTPLLRSMEVLSTQALRILKLFGKDAARVNATVGAEQEYFLVDKAAYLKRPDLLFTGRTLLGCPPVKGQELDDHYFGSIKPRVSDFMKELEAELWKLGVYAKTKHDEVAPGQHEMAPIYTTTNIATDHNQLIMELMKSVADKHNLACLLHEKPFAGFNGSGKHNNWSISTDKGVNLLEPGDTPRDNAQFLLFLVAIIKAVDCYQDLLRCSVVSAANDLRLGANEAPPAIISMFIGDELTAILESVENGTPYQGTNNPTMEIGVTVLPHFPKDSTDRNRTSPFAFTGNKFEFRMPGSQFSIAEPNIALNTAVADVLKQFADILENQPDFDNALDKLIKETITAHKRIIYKDDNYADAWVQEANRRGLSHLKNTPEALPALLSKGDLFIRHHIFNESELQSRYHIQMECYCKTVTIEALTLLNMVNTSIIPACIDYQNEVARLFNRKNEYGDFECVLETKLLRKLSKGCTLLVEKLEALEELMAQEHEDIANHAVFCRDRVLIAMGELRAAADALESIVAKKHWPFPSYGDLMYSV